MATEEFEGFYVETRNYGATGAFWTSLGFENAFETDHGSGQWEHPARGPYVFINEQDESDLRTHPVLHLADSTTFRPDRPADFAQQFTAEHWGVVEALVRDPDGRIVSLQAPLPEGVVATDAGHRPLDRIRGGPGTGDTRYTEATSDPRSADAASAYGAPPDQPRMAGLPRASASAAAATALATVSTLLDAHREEPKVTASSV